MALLFNPVRRDELFNSETGKIKDTLIPDIAAVGDATDITFDPGREFAPESTNVDLALVEAINRVKSLESAGGGSGGDGAINGEYTTMTNAGTNNVIQLTNSVTLPVGWSEIQAESEYVLSTGTASATRFEVYSSDITPVANETYVDYGVRAIGLNRDSHTFYVNNTGSETVIILRITTDAGTVTSAKSRLLVKSLATAPAIVAGTALRYSGGGGGGGGI